jgi:hypothetical protein
MQVRSLITNVLKESHSVASSDTFEDQESLKKIEVALDKIKLHLSKKSRTARLWIQYIHYVGVVKQFLTAEHICNWKLHLASVTEMLCLFAATGHNSYVRSARLYVQMMLKLNETHPFLYEMFEKYGFHSVH